MSKKKANKLEYGATIPCPNCGVKGKILSGHDGGIMVIDHDTHWVDLPGRNGGVIPANVTFSACRIYPDGFKEKFGRDHAVKAVDQVAEEEWESM